MVEKGEIPCCWFFGNFLLCCCFSPFLYYEEYKQKQINNDKELLVPLQKSPERLTTKVFQKGIKQNFVKEE